MKGEWSRRVALHEACMRVQVHTGTCTRMHWDAHQTFFVRKSGEGGGESKQILRVYGFKKTSKITDDPLIYPALSPFYLQLLTVHGKLVEFGPD